MKRIIFALILSLGITICFAQKQNKHYLNYIEKYKTIAVAQMQRYRIPASIILAQGLLESGAGRSTLATKSNNHFGIKCGGNWRGATVSHDDDGRGECFRAYRHPKESYEDHSMFLVGGKRYSFLFQLKTSDYKGWARGLKKAGYATDPSYANKLISIIENYELYRFDGKKIKIREQRERDYGSEQYSPIVRDVYLCNDIAYVVAKDGDTFKSIAKDMGIGWRKLIRYNDLHKGYTLEAGDRVYLKKKKRKADRLNSYYIVEEGDSMHSISQKYGVKMKSLYKINNKKGDYLPEVGDRIRLR